MISQLEEIKPDSFSFIFLSIILFLNLNNAFDIDILLNLLNSILYFLINSWSTNLNKYIFFSSLLLLHALFIAEKILISLLSNNWPFLNFLELRTAKASHPEIRKVAELCKEAVMETYASIFLN